MIEDKIKIINKHKATMVLIFIMADLFNQEKNRSLNKR